MSSLVQRKQTQSHSARRHGRYSSLLSLQAFAALSSHLHISQHCVPLSGLLKPLTPRTSCPKQSSSSRLTQDLGALRVGHGILAFARDFGDQVQFSALEAYATVVRVGDLMWQFVVLVDGNVVAADDTPSPTYHYGRA